MTEFPEPLWQAESSEYDPPESLRLGGFFCLGDVSPVKVYRGPPLWRARIMCTMEGGQTMGFFPTKYDARAALEKEVRGNLWRVLGGGE